MQWFRFYTEAISDKKLRRIARDNGESMAHVLGVWTIVLAIASDSPVRGRLLISDDVPATIDDINDAAGCNVTATFQKLFVTGLVTATVTDDGKTVYEVPAWDKRQFESDSSATRVRRHRERKKEAANVTEVKRYSNAPDTDTETDSNTNAPADAVPTEPSLADRFHVLLAELKETKNKPAKLREIYVLCFGDADAPTFSRLGQVAKDVGGAGNLAQYLFQNVTRPPAGDVLAYIATTHKNRTNGGNGNGGAFVANGTGYVMPAFGGSER